MTRARTYKLMGVVTLAAAALFLVRVASPVHASSSLAARSTDGPQARITQPIDNTQVVKLRGNVHPLARPQFDQGAVADSVPMSRMLLLLERSPKQEAALEKLLQEQQIKGSPNFHKWLTPEEFGKQFGPADADMQKITQWLASEGFHGIKVAAGRTVVEFSGDVAQVRSTFHTEIHQYQVRGKLYQANVNDPAIPAALAPVVTGIVSLNNFPRQSYRHTLGPFKRTAGGRVVPEVTGANGSFFALGPADFATIYNSTPLLNATPAVNGTGVKIGIVGDSNINAQDVNDFRTIFGLAANPVHIVLNGTDPGLTAAEGEGDLDAEWSGAVAQGATIDFVASQDTLTAFGGDLSALYIVDNNSDDILSESFGICEAAVGAAGNAFYKSLWEQAAAQGITVVVATGDGGSAGCEDFNTATMATSGLAVSAIASTPFNTAAGGTDFDDAGTQTSFWNSTNDSTTLESAKGYIPERTWNDSCAATATTGNLTTCANATSNLLNIVAGSGGPSSVYAKPAYQTQSGLTPADSARDTPDISFFAGAGSSSKSFYVVCQADAIPPGSPPSCNASGGTFSFLGEGGTSASTPAFAGVMAMIDQQNGGRQGNANVILYKIAQSETFSNCNSTNQPLAGGPLECPLYDVTKGNISVPCAGGSPNCSSTTSGTTGVLAAGSPKAPAWTTAAGYDLATGLGSINIANLASAWPTALGTFTGTATVLAATSSTTIVHGHSVSFTATVSPTMGAGTPTGDVSLLAPTALPNSAGVKATLSGGTATITTTTLPGGTYSVTAHYAGDTTFAPSDSNAIPVIVAKENSGLQAGIVTFSPSGAITSTNAASFEYGSPYILHMDVLNSSANATNCQPLTTGTVTGCALEASGTIALTDNSAPLDGGSFGVNSEGEAEDQAIQLPAGAHTLSASYSGDASYNASGPVTDMVTVTKATTAASVSSNLTSITSGGTVMLTAIVSSNSNSTVGPSGTVQFLSNGANLGSAATCTPMGATNTAGASCAATLTTTLSALPPGPVGAPPGQAPPVPLVWLVALSALLCVLLLRSRRRGYAYVALAFLLLLVGGFAACSGGSSSGTSSGPRTLSVTGQYSGDSNYASSTSAPTIITVR
jgi:Pro-kumamolisin, activation domain/Bacterial Ig-like domain (group 3)